MNKIIKNTLILAAITVVSGLVLGAAYEVTKGPIAQTQAKQKQEACQAVYPEADSFEAMDVDQKAAKEAIKKMGTNATVDEVYCYGWERSWLCYNSNRQRWLRRRYPDHSRYHE